MEQKKFKIEIQETLSRVVEVEASSADQALDIVQSLYSKENIVLDSNDFAEVRIKELS